MTELSLLIVTPYLDEEKPMPGEDGMSDLPLIGETQYLPDDKGDGLVAQEYESKNENCASSEIEIRIEDSQVNGDENIISSEEIESDSAIQNGSTTEILVNDTTIEIKDVTISSEVTDGDLKQQNTLENDCTNDTVEEEIYKNKILNLESELSSYKNKYDILFTNSTTIDNALLDAQKKLKDVSLRLDQKDSELSEMESKFQTTSNRMQEERLAAEKSKNDANECEILRSQLAKITSDNENLLTDNKRLQESVQKTENMLHVCQENTTPGEQIKDISSGESNYISELETSLNEANDKISELLKVKERYAEVDLEKTNLGHNLSELEEEMDVLSFQTRTATACSMVPLVILVLAIMVAYLPYLSSLFGTVD